MELKVSHMGLELTYIGLKLTQIGLNLTYMGLTDLHVYVTLFYKNAKVSTRDWTGIILMDSERHWVSVLKIPKIFKSV